MKHALIYARVSTLTQKANETIEGQVKRLKQYCKNHNLNIYHVYRDEGISGASEERIIDLVKYLQENHKHIDCIVFTYFDRIARDIYLQLWLEKECKKLDIDLIATEQDLFNNAQDPMQKAMKQMMSVFAELEKNIIASRLKKGRSDKAKDRGIKSQGACPLGYNYAGKTTKDKHIVVNMDEAKIVREIFRTFIDTGSTTKTAKTMNDLGYVNKRGNPFTKQAIQKILKNDFYKGIVTYNGEKRKGQHEAIISPHLFTKAQKLFKQA